MIIGLIKDLAGLLNQSSLNTLTFQFTGSFYVKLPAELRSAKKGLSHIKNEDQKCFLWCYVRHINSVKYIQRELRKKMKDLLIILIMMELNFLCKKKILIRLKQEKTCALPCLVMKMD